MEIFSVIEIKGFSAEFSRDEKSFALIADCMLCFSTGTLECRVNPFHFSHSCAEIFSDLGHFVKWHLEKTARLHKWSDQHLSNA